MSDILTKITASVISNQIALDCNHEIKQTGYYKHDLKKQLNLLIPILEKAEKNEFDAYFDQEETPTTEIYKGQADMIKEISSLGLEHFENITAILKAYKKNQKSINGIVNKINK